MLAERHRGLGSFGLWTNSARVRRWKAFAYPRVTILVFAVPVLVLKLIIAARTYGTDDVWRWGDFIGGVRRAGPVGIYGLDLKHSFYNHPPLIGYFLWLVNVIQDGVGIPYRFTIRAVSSFADVGSALVIYALLRHRRGIVDATCAGVLVAVSPVLFMVSGFHGNTDPIFVFLTMASVYLLVDRRAAGLAGAILALAVGVKIVPMVVIPILAIYALRRGPRVLLQFGGCFAVVFALTWGPALILQFGRVRAHVLGYAGSGGSNWGFMQVGQWLGNPGWVQFAAGPGRGLLVLICALVPTVAVWRRPGVVVTAVAWSLILFLALAPSFSVQYLVWAVAASYLVNIRWATLYSMSAGVVLFQVYNRWSGGLPWYWGHATVFTNSEKVLLLLPWAALAVTAVIATSQLFPRKQDSAWLRRPGATTPSGGRPSGRLT